MRQQDHTDRRYLRTQAALRTYRLALLLAVISIVILTTVLLAGRCRFARVIKIDGEIATLVASKKAADQVGSRLLKEGKQDLPGEASFAQQWEDASWPIEGREVLSVPQAIELLRPRLSVLVSAAAIEVDEQEAVVIATKELAGRVLDEVKRTYVGKDEAPPLEPQKFRQDVRIAEVSRPYDEILTDVSAAVAQLTTSGTTAKTYVVKTGDWPAKIAHNHGMSLAKLKELNPGVASRILYPGDELRVSAATAPLTVVTVKEETRIEQLPPETQEIHTPTLPKGKREVAREGKPGKKKIWDKVVYENDKAIRREPIRDIILEEPQAERVLVGTGPAAVGGGSD
ncbi:MAG: G5 domain-containing protein, partial [Armatimonadetes bacterium]|nr:G5 domain-containing protein [Armatimonadota bacterium]